MDQRQAAVLREVKIGREQFVCAGEGGSGAFHRVAMDVIQRHAGNFVEVATRHPVQDARRAPPRAAHGDGAVEVR